MKEAFLDFAKEEARHKAKLLNVKKSGGFLPAQERVIDLKIGDYIVDVEASSDMDYQEALVLAMKREKAAFRLYSDLAEAVDDAELKNTLLNLANEEAKHKLFFEVEYDEKFLPEN